MTKQVVVKIGGSVVSNLTDCNTGFFNFKEATKLAELLITYLDKGAFIIGGGKLNKWILENALANLPTIDISDQHYLSIAALNLNAELFKIVLKHKLGKARHKELYDNILRYADFKDKNFLQQIISKYNYVIVGAYKPGVSSDYDALTIAQMLGARRIVSIKNVDRVYSADPNKDKDAVSYDKLTWDKYLKIIDQKEHAPRGNFPVDPVTARLAKQHKLEFAIVGYQDLNNLKKALLGEQFYGTLIY